MPPFPSPRLSSPPALCCWCICRRGRIRTPVQPIEPVCGLESPRLSHNTPVAQRARLVPNSRLLRKDELVWLEHSAFNAFRSSRYLFFIRSKAFLLLSEPLIVHRLSLRAPSEENNSKSLGCLGFIPGEVSFLYTYSFLLDSHSHLPTQKWNELEICSIWTL